MSKNKLIFIESERLEYQDSKTIRILIFDRDMPNGPVAITTRVNKKPMILHGNLTSIPYPTVDGIMYDHYLERK